MHHHRHTLERGGMSTIELRKQQLRDLNYYYQHQFLYEKERRAISDLMLAIEALETISNGFVVDSTAKYAGFHYRDLAREAIEQIAKAE